MTMLPKTFLVLGLGLVMLPGCPLLDIQADAPEVCLTYRNLEVNLAAAQSSTKQSFVFADLSAVHDLAKQNADLQFVRAEIRATSGLDSLGFIQAVRIVVSSGDPGTTLPPLTMYDCAGDCVQDGKLEITAADGSNAIEYLRSSSVGIDLEFQGEIPAGSWAMDVDVCMKASASYVVSP